MVRVLASGLCGLFLLLSGSHIAEASQPFRIVGGHEAAVSSLLGETSLPGDWDTQWIRIERESILMSFSRGDKRITARLQHRSLSAEHYSKNYSIGFMPRGDVPAADFDAIVSTVVRRIQENDRIDVWSSWGREVPRPPSLSRVSALTWMVGGVLLAGILLIFLVRFLLPRPGSGLLWDTSRPKDFQAGKASGGVSNRELLLMGVLVLLAFLIYWVPPYLEYLGYCHDSHDFGIYTHAFWHALQGNGFYNSPEAMDHLGSHASPFLYFLLPVYALVPRAQTLLVLDCAALALTAFPAYRIARRRFGTGLSLFCTVCLLGHPAMMSLAHDFHAVTFATPILLWCLYFLESRRAVPFLAMLCLAFLCKENVGMVALAIGAFLVVGRETRFSGLVAGLLGVLWLVVGIGMIIPMHYGGHHESMFRFSHLGSNWMEILASPLARPEAFWNLLVSSSAVKYLTLILFPLAFIPVFAPRHWLLFFPILMQNLLSSHDPMRSGAFHYEALLVPGLFLAFVVGLERLIRLAGTCTSEKRTAWFRRAVVVVAGLTLIGHFASGYREYFERGLSCLGSDSGRRTSVEDVLAGLPDGAGVLSPNYIQPHLFAREVSDSYSHPADLDEREALHDYVILPVSDPNGSGRNPEALSADHPFPGRFEVVRENKRFLLLRRSDVSSTQGDGS